jgi:3-oxo-5alpha-steroid 4-dehydrogenase
MSESERTGPATPLVASEVSRWDAEAEVVVVGLGAAGACAAIEAAGAGASVLVLERAGGGGGTTAVSDGMMYFGGGTALQRACGFDDSVEEMVKYLMASCGPEPDEARIRTYCEQSAAHYDWLVELGVPFKAEFYPGRMLAPGEEGLTYSGNELVYPFREQATPAPRAHMPQKEGQAGAFLMQKLIETAERAGARIEANVLCERLVVDGRRVVGVQATQTGETRHFRARRGVVLCAGGFVNNREMIRQYAPTLRKARFRAATDGDDGRGIRMGMGAGGAAIRMDTGSVTLPFYPPKQLMRGIFVNQHGQRFMPEDVYQGRAGEIALLQQEGRVWLVLDDESFERPVFAGGEILAAETIEELESEIGFAAGSLQSTVELYNAGAERGEDPVFHKASEYVQPLRTPPFGAIDLSWEKAIYAVFTLGGLATDTEARVLNPDGIPVSGLWAAGRTAASISSPGYSSGTSIGEAQIFGRIAGRCAAAGRAQ